MLLQSLDLVSLGAGRVLDVGPYSNGCKIHKSFLGAIPAYINISSLFQCRNDSNGLRGICINKLQILRVNTTTYLASKLCNMIL